MQKIKTAAGRDPLRAAQLAPVEHSVQGLRHEEHAVLPDAEVGRPLRALRRVAHHRHALEHLQGDGLGNLARGPATRTRRRGSTSGDERSRRHDAPRTRAEEAAKRCRGRTVDGTPLPGRAWKRLRQPAGRALERDRGGRDKSRVGARERWRRERSVSLLFAAAPHRAGRR